MEWLLMNKPLLIGLHLGAAILGIDGFLWLLGELFAERVHVTRARIAGLIGLFGFIGSWLLGGYYYLNYYGSLVKPGIVAGTAPWGHKIAMEAKEHIFLFLVPMAFVAVAFLFVDPIMFESLRVKKGLRFLTATIAILGLVIGAMGYIISAAARWAV